MDHFCSSLSWVYTHTPLQELLLGEGFDEGFKYCEVPNERGGAKLCKKRGPKSPKFLPQVGLLGEDFDVIWHLHAYLALHST